MAGVWEFVKRHKGKIVAGGVLIGGAIAYGTSHKQSNFTQQTPVEDDILKLKARRHYVFDSNQRTCDQSIVDLVPTLKASLEKRFGTELYILVEKIQSGEAIEKDEKRRIWMRIVELCLARTVALAYSYSVLTVALKAQISVLAAEICTQFEGGSKNNGWFHYISNQMMTLFHSDSSQSQKTDNVEAADRQVFLQCIKFFTTTGVNILYDIVESATKTVCQELTLSTKFNKSSIRVTLDSIDKAVAFVLQSEIGNIIAPMSKVNVPNDGIVKLLKHFIHILMSDNGMNTISALTDFYYSAVCNKVDQKDELLPSVSTKIANVFDQVSSNGFDGPLQSSLCSSIIHAFAVSIFNGKFE